MTANPVTAASAALVAHQQDRDRLRRRVTLLAIGEDMQTLAALLDEAADERDGELRPEDEAVLSAWFAELDKDLIGKAEGYAALIREKELLIAARKEEIDQLKKRASADENLVRRLKDRLLTFMQERGIKKIATKRPITVCGNGGKQPLQVLVPPAALPPHLQKVTVEADTEAVRLLLETDLAEGSKYARLLARWHHLRIG